MTQTMKQTAIAMVLACTTTLTIANGTDLPDNRIVEAKPMTFMGVPSLVLSDNGKLFISSQDGRFLFEVEGVVDVWQTKRLTSLNEIMDATNIMPMRESLSDMDLNVGVTGNGPLAVDVFIDLHCTFCHQIIEQSKALEDEYTFRWHLLSVFESSRRTTRQLACVQDQRLLGQAIRNGSTEQLAQATRDCADGSERYNASLILGDVLGIKGVPWLIASNGRVHQGVPPQLGQWLNENR